jgi:CRP-like cAMP-binding protein
MTKTNFDELLEFLKHVTLFKDIPENLIQLLLKAVEIKEFKRGEDIITEGEHGNTIFILMNGEVSVTKKLTLLTSQSGTSQVDKALIKLKHTNYAFFGEMAMCGDGDVRSATVRAETECILAELTAEQIKSVMDDNPEFGAKFYQNLSGVLADRLRKSNRDILKLTTALTMALEE